MDVVTDFPERLKPGVWLLVGPNHQHLKIRSVRWHDRSMLVAFSGYKTPEEIGEFRNMEVYVPVEDRAPLEEGEYYHHQIIGLKVFTEEEKPIGTVREILETGSNDVLVVHPESGADVLIPFIESTILEIDLGKGFIRMQMLPGLLPEE
jgi:16S rRNA processing protein RimM